MTGLLALMIAPGNPRVGEDLRDWNGELRAVLNEPGGREHFVALLTYIMGVVRHEVAHFEWARRSEGWSECRLAA